MDDPQKKHIPITVAMSGGVDSTVTAALLKQQGHPVAGVFLALAQPDLERQVDRVSRIAERLAIPFSVLDLHLEFEQEVLAYFVQSYFAGLTPNPCIVCNRTIKFGSLLQKVLAGGSQGPATGHYVRLIKDDSGLVRLFCGRDSKKDQSYFLCRLRQEQVARLSFPLGNYTKEEVYKLAEDFGFTEFRERRESQDICFLPNGGVGDFLAAQKRLPPARGAIVTLDGRHVGRHDGIHGFTVGQRRGLGIPDATPYYVVSLDPAKNRVVVGKESDLWSQRLLVRDMNWLSGRLPDLAQTFAVKIRYRHVPADAVVRIAADDMLEVAFHHPQRAITPGQFVAVYQGDELLGGGEIVITMPESQ
ncbi:MAG: tRNA 2-thiouridine(34) synthase MnmA [Deltaproteobacteria bacterium RIFOXYD12_FULL_50_9]|nr:MAG: tRNA 2-thiouridine(34) synthase MnmA [Deltaproteobacteria bacterium RIFOXYD12_FULL_50_9]